MALYVRVDNRIRLTASALLLTRFCQEQSHYKWHPLKHRVLSYITPLNDHDFVKVLNKLAERWFMNAFYSIALLLEPFSSGFKIPKALGEQIPDLYSYRYAELLWEFKQDAELEKCWSETADLWEQNVSDCESLLEDGKVAAFLDLVYGPTSRQFLVVPNPLDPASFGFGISTSEGYFSIIAPPAIPKSDSCEVRYALWGDMLCEMVVHELSHSLLGVARSRCPMLVDATKHLASKITPRGYFAKMYDNWEIQLDEMIIRAVEALYLYESQGMSAAEQKLSYQESEYGIPLIRPIFKLLSGYLEDRREGKYNGLRDFMPELADQLTRW